jgi:flavin-dependent dehydrogenase
VLERSYFCEPRVGESLAPSVQPLLRKLGVWEAFCDVPQVTAFGCVSVWGAAEPQDHSYMSNVLGRGFHVERCAFDRMLARAAEHAGAQLQLGTTLVRCDRERDGFRVTARSDEQQRRSTTHVRCDRERDGSRVSASAESEQRRGTASVCDDSQRDAFRFTARADGASAHLARAPSSASEPLTFRARVVIDATGRSAHVARQLGARRVLFDRAVAVAARWPAHHECPMLVEACAPGWFYSAPISDEQLSVMWMTDADLYAGTPLTAALQQAPHTRALLRDQPALTGVRVHCAHSQRLVHAAAGPYLTVGDAALATDPIAGNGVARALRSASAAAQAVTELLDAPLREQEVLDAYHAAYDQECTRYLLERVQYYSAEQRFATPYWQRRAQAAARLHASVPAA